MNSIVQEASSMARAIEQAWEKAGKPQKFSIRVFQESEKNFLGMTKQPAKIALLFEKQDIKAEQKKESRRPTHQAKTQRQSEHRQRQQKPREQHHQQKKPQRIQEPEGQPAAQKKRQREIWTDEMIAIARNWMKDMLIQVNKSDTTFTTEVKRYHLKFILDKPIAESEEKQKSVFRNFAHLIMQSIRNKMKKQLRYHKVVITSSK